MCAAANLCEIPRRQKVSDNSMDELSKPIVAQEIYLVNFFNHVITPAPQEIRESSAAFNPQEQ